MRKGQPVWVDIGDPHPVEMFDKDANRITKIHQNRRAGWVESINNENGTVLVRFLTPNRKAFFELVPMEQVHPREVKR